MSKITNKQVHTKLMLAHEKIVDAMDLIGDDGVKFNESIIHTLKLIIDDAQALQQRYVFHAEVDVSSHP